MHCSVHSQLTCLDCNAVCHWFPPKPAALPTHVPAELADSDNRGSKQTAAAGEGVW